MSDLNCPWCDGDMGAAAIEVREQTCPECMTTWCYEDEPVELALAA